MRRSSLPVVAAVLFAAMQPARAETAAPADSARKQYSAKLRLLGDPDKGTTSVVSGVMKPFDAYLVASRDSTQHEISAVAFALQLPDGILSVGEELLVEQLVALGSTKEGLNLVFRCVDGPSVRVLRFRFVATRPLEDAVIALGPDPRTHWLGVVSCRPELFDKFDTEPALLHVKVHP